MTSIRTDLNISHSLKLVTSTDFKQRNTYWREIEARMNKLWRITIINDLFRINYQINNSQPVE